MIRLKPITANQRENLTHAMRVVLNRERVSYSEEDLDTLVTYARGPQRAEDIDKLSSYVRELWRLVKNHPYVSWYAGKERNQR